MQGIGRGRGKPSKTSKDVEQGKQQQIVFGKLNRNEYQLKQRIKTLENELKEAKSKGK